MKKSYFKSIIQYLAFSLSILVLFSCSNNIKAQELTLFHSNKNGKIGYVNKHKQIVFEPIFSSGTYFKNNMAVVTIKKKEKERFALINSDGSYIIPFKDNYQLISPSSNKKGWVFVIKNNKCGYINLKKEVMIPIEYESLGDFYGDLAYAKKNKLYGFINTKNDVIIEYKYEQTMDFGPMQPDGYRYAQVQKNKKIGFLNNQGKLVIPFKFDFVYPFENGLAIVKLQNNYGCIDTSGKIIVPLDFAFVKSGDSIVIAKKEFPSKDEYRYKFNGEFLGVFEKD